MLNKYSIVAYFYLVSVTLAFITPTTAVFPACILGFLSFSLLLIGTFKLIGHLFP